MLGRRSRRPSERRPGWWLADGEALHAAHPRSFFIPPAEDRRTLRVGQEVKLLFKFDLRTVGGQGAYGERMWVRVTDVFEGGAYAGTLANDPTHLAELKFGDPVRFGPASVIAISYDDSELGYDVSEWALVDQRILADDVAPVLIARRTVPGTDAPAWVGEVHEAEATSPQWMSLGDLTDRWPELADVFRSDTGVWRRDAGTGAYRAV
jgi:hypothetical protein